jgi:hypothetical protein
MGEQLLLQILQLQLQLQAFLAESRAGEKEKKKKSKDVGASSHERGGGGWRRKSSAHAYFNVFLSFPSGEGLQALRLSVDDAQLGLQRASSE